MKAGDRYCIQCTDVTSGEVGCFTFTESPQGLVATSAVYPGLVEFYAAARAEGLTSAPGLPMRLEAA